MKKVCLIHPNHENSTDCRLDPPLGLLYIAYNLLLHGISVEINDLSGRDDYYIPYADVYGITVYITSINETKKIIEQCKIVNPDCKIVVGGAHPTARPNDFPYVDKVIQGYGENEFIQYLYPEKKFKSIPVLDLLPAYELVDINSYHRKIDGEKSLPIITSRGCTGKCAFCGLTSMHKRNGGVKFASPEQIYKQLEQIYKLGIKTLNIQDDIFTLSRKRLKKILNIIKEFGFKFRCMGRAGYDIEETYKMLASSGCSEISWGIESGSQYILDRMRKDVKVQDNYNVIQWAKKYGIKSRGFFIIGFPGETKATLEETKNFIINSDIDQYFFSNFIPYPGTDVALNPEKYGIINMSDNFDDYYQVSKDGTGGAVIDTKWLSKQEFKKFELEFREWIKNNKLFVGSRQDYEKILYGDE